MSIILCSIISRIKTRYFGMGTNFFLNIMHKLVKIINRVFGRLGYEVIWYPSTGNISTSLYKRNRSENEISVYLFTYPYINNRSIKIKDPMMRLVSYEW